MIKKITLNFLFLLSLFGTVLAETPTLRFPEEFSWKGIFDAGFRPKHISGLERVKAECRDQEMIIQFKDQNLFPLERGRLSFEIQSDDRIRIMEHLGRVPITLEEAERRLKLFHQIFDTAVTRKGSLPPIVDKKFGRVASLPDYDAVAKLNQHAIYYGFESSYQKEKPVLPVFMISYKRPKGELRPPIRRHIVEPPEGYEDYDLTPVDEIAEFYKAQEEKSKNARAEKITRPAPRDAQNELSQNIEKETPATSEKSKYFLVWILAGLALFAMVILLFKGKPTS